MENDIFYLSIPDDWFRWLFWMTVSDDCFRCLFQMTFPDDCSDDYLEWLFRMPISVDCSRWLFRMPISDDFSRWLFRMTVRDSTTDSYFSDQFVILGAIPISTNHSADWSHDWFVFERQLPTAELWPRSPLTTIWYLRYSKWKTVLLNSVQELWEQKFGCFWPFPCVYTIN